MFNDQFPATRKAIRSLQQMRAAQDSRPSAVDEIANDREAPPPPAASGPAQASAAARDLVMRLTVEASQIARQLDISITIGAPQDKPDVVGVPPDGSEAPLTIAVAIGHNHAPAITGAAR